MNSKLQKVLSSQPAFSTHFKRNKDKEFWEYLLMLGFDNYTQTGQFYKFLRSELPKNDWRRPLVEIGEAKVLSIAGRSFECQKRLEKVSKQIFKPSVSLSEWMLGEIQALYYYVQSTHNYKIDHLMFPIPSLTIGERMTSMESFKEIFRYNIAGHAARWLDEPISNMIPHIKNLEQMGFYLNASLGYKWTGYLNLERKNYKEAHKWFEHAITLAEKHKSEYQIQQISNSIGYLYYLQNRLEEAELKLSKIRIETQIDPIIPIRNENLALIFLARKDYNKAVSLLKDALIVSTELDSIRHLPGELHYLGHLYETYYKDFEQAEFYYKQAHDHSMRYARHGISLTGDRKEAVEEYVRFMEERKVGRSPASSQKRSSDLTFAGGKTWKEIKDIFHHQLILYHRQTIKSSKALALKMGLPPSTLYSIQERLKKRGYLLPGRTSQPADQKHALFNFIEENQDLSWEEINTIFEREMIHYLYEKYGYNKQRMAQILDLSYPSIITKTRELTKVNEHLLPN